MNRSSIEWKVLGAVVLLYMFLLGTPLITRYNSWTPEPLGRYEAAAVLSFFGVGVFLEVLTLFAALAGSSGVTFVAAFFYYLSLFSGRYSVVAALLGIQQRQPVMKLLDALLVLVINVTVLWFSGKIVRRVQARREALGQSHAEQLSDDLEESGR